MRVRDSKFLSWIWISICDEKILPGSTSQKLWLPIEEWRPVSLAGQPESLVRHYRKQIGKLVAPEEATKAACWVVVEGEYGLLHLSHDPLQLMYTCGDLKCALQTLHIKAEWCIPMTVGAHAVEWGSAMSGCQLWVLVRALVYGVNTLYHTSVIYKRKIQLVRGFTRGILVYKKKGQM